jgi:hypothetical protein
MNTAGGRPDQGADREGVMETMAPGTVNERFGAEKWAINARALDLCCGMGGLSVAAREMGMRVVAGVDVNSIALRTFGRNFPEAEAIEGSVQSRTVLERCSVVGARCSNSANHGRVRMSDHRQPSPDNRDRMPPRAVSRRPIRFSR